MNIEFDFPFKFNERTVYVRPVNVSELSAELQEQAADLNKVYAIYTKDGKRLALAKDRDIAFKLARTNEFSPVSVH